MFLILLFDAFKGSLKYITSPFLTIDSLVRLLRVRNVDWILWIIEAVGGIWILSLKSGVGGSGFLDESKNSYVV